MTSEVVQRPQLFTIGDGHYVLDCDSAATQFDVSQVRRDRNGELRCSLEVRTALAGAQVLDPDGGILNRYDAINLSDNRRRADLASDIERRAKTTRDDCDWRALLDDLAFQVGRAESRGQPAVWLPDIPSGTGDTTFTADGFTILRQHPQIVFGDGGSLKSYLMLHWAGTLARQGIRPMFVDWELDATDHRERAAALWGAEIPSVLYVRCSRPLVSELDRLARLKHEHRIDFAFLDSIAFLCHGKPEDAEIAGEVYRALRSLSIGSLLSAHITKAGDMAEHRPFGSAFWHNGARQTFFAKAEDEHQDSTHGRTVALINRKTNLSARRAAIAYRFTFNERSVLVRRTDPATVDSIASALPQWQRIKAAITSGPMTIAEIAAETGIKEDSIRKSVTRSTRTFKVFEGANGLQRVALLETRAS